MNLQFNAAVIDEDIVYFSAKNFNGLFKWNLKNSKVELIGHFPDEQLWTEHMHQFTIVNAKNIYYLPYMASSITKYDLTSQKLLTVGELGNSVRWGISHVLKYNENYILIPRELTNPISVFYPANEKFEFVDVEITKNAETVYFYSDIFCATIERDTLFVPIYDTNIIIKIDLQSKCKSKVFLDAIQIS